MLLALLLYASCGLGFAAFGCYTMAKAEGLPRADWPYVVVFTLFCIGAWPWFIFKVLTRDAPPST